MPIVARDGCNLSYELHGRQLGTSPVLNFAHGAGGNHLSWWQQVPHFATRFSCVTFDHRSFGHSVALTDDLRALIDHLAIP